MPQAGARRRHTFAVQGDAALLRSALHASARQTGARTIEVELRVADAGHDVPTGDMFRRLVVRATMGDAAAEPRVLARRFRKTATADGARRLQTGDDRLSATGEPTVVSLLFLQPIAEAVDWEVVYQRMGPYEAALFGVDIAAEEVVVARGQISGERNP